MDPRFDWGQDRPPRTPWQDTIIYETHVKGLTKLHTDVPEKLRGTYAGLAHASVIRYLRGLGVTAVQLLPVHEFVQDRHLLELGLSNYWGYQSIGFFAPHAGYSSSGIRGQQVTEFKSMVRALHAAGLEVLLDVVYNHTGEGGRGGPTLCFRGADNRSYYRLEVTDPRYYVDYAGTGNTLDLTHPRVLQLVLDSLRYWVQEMHVDGFRFDLATALARGAQSPSGSSFDRASAFFKVIAQDPVLSQVKLIAEPWDPAEGGYQAGNFPEQWAEWNDRYRDCIRRYWRGDPCQVGEFATRLTGSNDLYAHNGRRPYASINFVTCHDGFTLRDQVSYNAKHNALNGEDNRDGVTDNSSWNCGAEGPTNDPEILALRERQMRNMMTTLLISQGVPMLLHGDESARTQHGNNNAYCQDNKISWQQWALTTPQARMLEWTRRVIAFRKAHPILRRREYFHHQAHNHQAHNGDRVYDIYWLTPTGEEMSDAEWRDENTRELAVWLSGRPERLRDELGRPVIDDTLLFLFNASDTVVPFTLPRSPQGKPWARILNTFSPEESAGRARFVGGEIVPVAERSISVLLHPTAAKVVHPLREEKRS